MNRVDEDLIKAISMCNREFTYRSQFSSIFSFTTETISGYIDYFDLKDKNLLTVGSSGDQALNAYLKGCRDITLLDINPFAKYYTYLKASAIYTLDYQEFEYFFALYITNYKTKNIYRNESMFSKDIFNKIKNNLRIMDYDSYIFFDELFSIFESNVIRNYLFKDEDLSLNMIKKYNNYLKSEVEYNKLKNKIKYFNINFINEDILEFESKDKYDNIILSNLGTVIEFDEYKLLIEKLNHNNLNTSGSMLITYLWDTNFEYNINDYYNLKLIKELFKDYISEYHDVSGAKNFLFNDNKGDDLVLIYRK